MSIQFLPSNLLRKMAPKKKIEEAINGNLSVNRAALTSLAETGILSKKTLNTIALKVVRQYKETLATEMDSGTSFTEAKDIALNDKKLMVQRVQNASIKEIAKEVQNKYLGEFYIWLPSDAAKPDPLHQLNYGKRFQIGRGEMPGDRYGCRCGMEILVNEDTLEL
jgi:ribosomal protein S17E